MTEIQRVVKAASLRLMLIDGLRRFVVLLTAAIGLALLARVVEKVFGLSEAFAPWWGRGAMIAGGAVVLGTILWTFFARKRHLAVARIVDDRANLREMLSTAMCVERSHEAWDRVVVEDARRKAVGVNVKQAIPLVKPRFWPAPIAAALALFIAWLSLPNWDVLKISEKSQQATAQKNLITQVKDELKIKDDKLKEMLAKAKVNLDQGNGDESEGKEGKERELDPEALRRSQVRKLTDISEQLQSLRDKQSEGPAEAMKKLMEQLKQPGDGPLSDLSKELAKGNFSKALADLKQLEDQLAAGDVKGDDAEQLKKQLENLSKQLEKLAENKEDLLKKLEQAGLDRKSAEEALKQAASNPDALKDALEKAQNLTPEQREKLMQMAESACKACENAGQMGEAMQQMAQGLSQEGFSQEGMEGAEALEGELSDSEMLQSDMENLSAALEEAKEQLSQLAGECMGGSSDGDGDGPGQPGEGLGDWKEGSSTQMGMGSGGPGQGQGAGPDEEASDYITKKEKANVQTAQGAIIGTRLVQGKQVKGEATQEFSQAVEASSKAAAEAIGNQVVRRELQDAVKNYFSTLKQKADATAPKSDSDKK